MKVFASILLFSVLLSGSVIASGETIVLEGHYQNKNLYVTNCFGEDGVGFAVSAVRVNGEVTSDAVTSSAFEINLTDFGLTMGDQVTIQIEYDGHCLPKVLNPGALQPVPTFELVDISISGEGLLVWKSKGETGSLPYAVEQYKWNKWVKIGEVDGVGSAGEHDYSFKGALVSGSNKFRVVQKNLNGNIKAGQAVSVTTSKEQPEFNYNKKTDQIEFTAQTTYEVYDMYGQIRKRGASDKIDFSNLEKGDYYVNFDNTMEKFRKN